MYFAVPALKVTPAVLDTVSIRARVRIATLRDFCAELTGEATLAVTINLVNRNNE